MNTPTIDELIEKLNSLADCDARAGAPLGKCMREAASTLTSLQERIRKLEEALRDVLAMRGIHLLRGTYHAPDCDCPLCRARALLGDGA